MLSVSPTDQDLSNFMPLKYRVPVPLIGSFWLIFKPLSNLVLLFYWLIISASLPYETRIVHDHFLSFITRVVTTF